MNASPPATDATPAPELALRWLVAGPPEGDRDTASTGSVGSDGVRATEVDATDRWTGASSPAPSSPASAPSAAERWIVARRLDVASGIAPAIVDRLTTGEAGAPTGRAAAGRLVGSPTPRLDAVGATVGRLVDESAVAGAGVAADGGVLAWRLTVGIAEREMVVPDCARRIPPDGVGSVGEAGVAASAADDDAACGWPAWLRWTGGRTTAAADVSGRSGTRIALRATVGSVRTGATSIGALSAARSS